MGDVGQVSLAAGSRLSLDGTYTNDLTLDLTNATLDLGGSWVNSGSIYASNATVNLGGSSSQLGTIVLPGSTLPRGGRFYSSPTGRHSVFAGSSGD